jgi:hypothetical protein
MRSEEGGVRGSKCLVLVAATLGKGTKREAPAQPELGWVAVLQAYVSCNSEARGCC